MSRIVVSQFVSVDGVIEDPIGVEGLGRGAWSDSASAGAEGHRFNVDEILETEAMLLGRTTYESYAGAWPSRSDEYADRINAIPKYVVSSTLDDPQWSNTTVLAGDVVEEVGNVKERHGGNILIHGSAQLVHTLMEHDLVDECRLKVYPVVVGKGKRFFGDPGRALDMKLAESRAVGEGVVILVYRVARG
jgi:dihydrofolate reductase